MPYYRITINLKNKKSVTDIREMDANTEPYRHFNKKIFEEYREFDVISFDIVQVSTKREVKDSSVDFEKIFFISDTP